MLENQIGKRFAEALSDSIQDTGKLGQALEAVTAVSEAFAADASLNRFFIHPSFSDEKKAELAKQLCDKAGAGEEVRRLMLLLVERQKIQYLKNIAQYFRDFVDRRLNQVRVEVISAHPIGQAALDKLKTSLDRQLGRTAIIKSTVDESLIGGIRLLVGSRVADATIKNRLEQLKNAIRNEEALSELAS